MFRGMRGRREMEAKGSRKKNVIRRQHDRMGSVDSRGGRRGQEKRESRTIWRKVLTRMALKTVELIPSATSNSPFSLGRVKLLSRPVLNILQAKNVVKSAAKKQTELISDQCFSVMEKL